jgi:hypothetical protein
VLVALSLAAFIAGCGTPSGKIQAALPISSKPSWWREAPESAKAGVYVTQTAGSGRSVLFGYPPNNRKNQSPLCSILRLGFAAGISSDTAGNVYVARADGTVRVYPPDCGRVVGTVDTQRVAFSVAVRNGTIYVGDSAAVAVCTLRGCSRSLTDASILQLTSAAVDSFGNVWAAYYSQSGAISLIVWQGASMPGHVVRGYINTPVPGDILFDAQDRLVSVASHFSTVFTYSCDAHAASCTNTGKVQLRAASYFGALNRANTNIQITDIRHASVDVYAYPSFTYMYSYNRGLNPNIAVEGITQTQ